MLLAATAALAAVLAGCGASAEVQEQPGPRSGAVAGAQETTPAPSRPEASAGEEGQGLGDEAEVRSQAQQAEAEARNQQAGPALEHPVYGADVSWPQCRKGMGIPERPGLGLPMPVKDARYVVIGLTNGPGFTTNPCLASQLDWVKERNLLASAYAVVSWPAADRYGGARHDGPYDGSTRLGKLRNAGYAQAEFNIRTLQRTGFRTPAIWVDVEPYPTFPWSKDVQANAAVVEGVVRAYEEAGFRVGFYSTQALWQQVVGDLQFGHMEWRAAGNTSVKEALSRCRGDSSIQGGPAVLAQWTDGRRDYNVTCPGQAGRLLDWFHQY